MGTTAEQQQVGRSPGRLKMVSFLESCKAQDRACTVHNTSGEESSCLVAEQPSGHTLPGIEDFYQRRRANAEHLLHCWNACEDHGDPADLRRQRDELLEALKQIMDLVEGTEGQIGFLDTCDGYYQQGTNSTEIRDAARAAIANVESTGAKQ